MEHKELPQSTDILICGAGPAGMSTALSITHHSPETKITIVDALPAGRNSSRAILMHPRTLEALGSLGSSEPFISAGLQATSISIQNTDHSLITAEYQKLDGWTKYPYIVLIDQSKTEGLYLKLLEGRNIRVVRPLKVVGMKHQDASDACGFTVTFDSGATIDAKYVIGADGARSTVRSLSGIQFQERPLHRFLGMIHAVPKTFVIADVRFDASMPKQYYISFTLRRHGFVILAPLGDQFGKNNATSPDEYVFRLGFYLTHEEEASSPDIDRDFLQKKFQRFRLPMNKGPLPLITQVVWANKANIRYALAGEFFKPFPNGGKVILVGDAAHIHSPAGGQGMNIGICDGLEAGAAIAAQIRTGDDQHLIDYATRHRDIAARTIETSKLLSWIGTLTGPTKTRLRDLILWAMGRFPKLRRGFAWQLSGLKFEQLKDCNITT